MSHFGSDIKILISDKKWMIDKEFYFIKIYFWFKYFFLRWGKMLYILVDISNYEIAFEKKNRKIFI